MNPWELFGWLAAGCSGVVLVVLTMAMVLSLFRSMRAPVKPSEKSTRVL